MRKAKKDYGIYVQDIATAIDRIEKYTSGGKSEFFSDGKTQDAVIRQFSVIGEASARLSPSMKAKHPRIPWKNIIGMRNIIIHDYAEVDLPIVWDTVRNGLPKLKKAILKMMKQYPSGKIASKI